MEDKCFQASGLNSLVRVCRTFLNLKISILFIEKCLEWQYAVFNRQDT